MVAAAMKKLFGFFKKVYNFYKTQGASAFLHLMYLYLRDFFGFLFARGDVLYISGCPGGSMKYRCFNLSEELRSYGIRTKVITSSCPYLRCLTKHFKIFIFHRVIYDKHVSSFIDDIKTKHKTIIFEIDDLVYDPKYVPYLDYYRHMGKEEKRWYDNGIGREILSDPYVEICLVSTDFLAKAVKNDYPTKKVFILRNKLALDQIKYAQLAFFKRNGIKPKDGIIRIGYFSGSKSHDKDFGSISDVLIEILKKYKNVVLMIVGFLTLDKKFTEIRSQIECHPFVSVKKLSELILRSDINIAPLEINNPFCNAKSELKFFEAGILGIPTVASATDAFKYAINDGVNGFLACNKHQWKAGIERLIEDKELRKSIGKQSRIDTLKRHTVVGKHPETELFVEFLHSL